MWSRHVSQQVKQDFLVAELAKSFGFLSQERPAEILGEFRYEYATS